MAIAISNQNQSNSNNNLRDQSRLQSHCQKQARHQDQLQLQLSSSDPNKQIGVVPKPRPTPPPRVKFTCKNYNYSDDQGVINLPVRPANLAKQDEQRFRNIIKQVAIDLEETNNHKFIAYRRSCGDKGDWWQAGGNSVLFYHYRLEKSYKLTPVKPRTDGDYGCTWPDNSQVIMIHNIKHIVEQLQEKVGAKCQLITPELVILELPIYFSPEAIADLRKIRQNKKAAINRLILPKVVHPHTHQSITELHRYLFNGIMKFTEPQRVAYGYDGLNLIKRLSVRFRSMSNERLDPMEYYTEALELIEQFCDWLLLAQDIGLFDTDTMYQLVERTNKVKRNIENELQQLSL